jgi:hypothetical protein
LVKWDTSLNTGKYPHSHLLKMPRRLTLSRLACWRFPQSMHKADFGQIGGCTDPTWNALNCFSHCKSSLLGGISTLYRCSNDNWCCSDGGNETSCCHDPKVELFKIVKEANVQNGTAFIQGYNIAPDQDIRGTATPSSAPSSTSGCTATTTSQSSSNLTAAGLGIGLGVGIPLLAAVGVLSFLLLREKKRTRDTSARRGSASSMGQIVGRPSVQAGSPRIERPSTQVGSPRTGYGELPNSHSVEAGVGQRRKIHELYGEDHQQVVEMPGQKA